MNESISFCRHHLRNTISIAAVVLSALQLQAQDECTSFGWANYAGQIAKGVPTGGGDNTPVEVTTFAALKSTVESSDAKVIYVMNDMGAGYTGKTGDVLYFKSNKTVSGAKPNITVKCSFQIKRATNVIIRNLVCRGPGNSNAEQNWDAVNIENAQRVWFDHCTVMEGEDGNFDVVKGSDNVTVTWCKFTYVTGGSHNLSNLIGSSDNESQSHGKLNVTYAYCWWENVNSRCPRTRYGKIHVLNCYYKKTGQGPFSGFMSNIRAEGCFFESDVTSPTGMTSPGGQSGVFVIGCNRGSNQTDGYNTVFTPPYTYKKYDNAKVKGMVTDPDCGAGPTMKKPDSCCGGNTTGTNYSWEDGVSPNPLLHAKTITGQDPFLYQIVQIDGKEMANGLTADIKTVGNGLKNGVYIVRIIGVGRANSFKIVKTGY